MMFEAARLRKGTGTCMLYWSKPISIRISGVCLSRQDASALVESSPLSRPREIYLVISARPAANAGNARTEIVSGLRAETGIRKGTENTTVDRRPHSSPRDDHGATFM